MLSRCAGLSVLAFCLSGCLASDEPLIGAADSVTPIPAGTYTIGDSKDAFSDDLTVTRAGTITRIAEGDDDTSDLWIRDLDRGYYVWMWQDDDAEYAYALLRVEAPGFTVYEPAYDCDRLRALWLGPGKAPADVGIVSIERETDSTCELQRYEDVARAFRALIDAGAIGEAEVYARK